MALEQSFYLGQLGGDREARERRLILSETRGSFLCRLCLRDQEIYGYLIPNAGELKFNIPAAINPDYSGLWMKATKQEIQKMIEANRHFGVNTITGMLGTGEPKKPIDFNVATYFYTAEVGTSIFYHKPLGLDAVGATDSRRALGFMILLEEQTGLILEPICKK